MKSRILLPIEPGQLRAVDLYRRDAGLPSRAAAIRHLIGRGMAPADGLAAALQVLRGMRETLARRGVARAAVFGSVARGDDSPDSDIDIVLSFDPKHRVDLIGFLALRDDVAAAVMKRTGRGADVVDSGSLRPAIAGAVARDAVYAF